MELEAIREKHGGMLNPEDIVEFARRQDTALHTAFEWNDGEAAHQYRIWQAQHLVRTYVTVTEGDTRGVRAYVSIISDRGDGGYRAMIDVSKDKALRAALLLQAKKEAEAFQRKYETLVELMPIFTAMRRVFKP